MRVEEIKKVVELRILIGALEAEIEEKDRQIDRSNSFLKKQLQECKERTALKEQAVENLHGVIDERDRVIAEQEKVIEEQEKTIQEQKRLIEGRMKVIEEQQSYTLRDHVRLEDQEKEIELQKATIAQLELRNKGLRKTKEELTEMLGDRQQKIYDLEQKSEAATSFDREKLTNLLVLTSRARRGSTLQLVCGIVECEVPKLGNRNYVPDYEMIGAACREIWRKREEVERMELLLAILTKIAVLEDEDQQKLKKSLEKHHDGCVGEKP